MSQEQIDTFRRAMEAFNRRDKEACMGRCDPAVEWLPPADWPEPGAVRGRDAVWDFMLNVNEPWEEGDYETAEVIDAGNDRLAVHQNRRVQGRGSGIDAEFDYWVVVSFREGQIVRMAWFGEQSEAFEAAGLPE